MDITITIPDPKFQVGDFVRYTKAGDIHGFLVIGRIHAIQANGLWGISPGHSDSSWVEAENYQYYITCQEGCLKTDGSPMRPGTFAIADVEELDECGEKWDYQGEVWTVDTPQNISQRWKDWDEKHKAKVP